MKQFYLSALFLMLFAGVHAQQHPGVRANLNYSMISSESLDIKSGIGFGVGGASEVIYTDEFSLYIDFFFQKFNNAAFGKKFNYSAGTFGEGSYYDMGLMGVYGSVLANYYLEFPHFSLNGGVTYGFSFTFKDEQDVYLGENPVEWQSLSFSQLQEGVSNQFDFFLTLGVSGGMEDFHWFARYSHSFKNLLNEIGASSVYAGEKLSKSFFQVGVSYIFLDYSITNSY